MREAFKGWYLMASNWPKRDSIRLCESNKSRNDPRCTIFEKKSSSFSHTEVETDLRRVPRKHRQRYDIIKIIMTTWVLLVGVLD